MATAVLVIRIALAAVFAIAAVGKLLDLEGSRRAVRDFGIPAGAASIVGLMLPVVELATAIALVPAPSASWGAGMALLLLVAFTVGIANALRRGEELECHCFGQIHSAPAGPSTLARNAVLALLALLVVVEGPGPAVDEWVGARSSAELVAVGAGAAAIVLGLLYAQLWFERRQLLRDLGLAQRMAAAAPPGIPIGSAAPNVTLKALGGEQVTVDSLRERGRPLLLVFVNPNCDSCVEVLPKLARWQQTLARRLTIAVISSGSARANQSFVDDYGLDDVVLQERSAASEAFRIRGTPSAVVVTSDGTIGSNPAETVFGIEPLLRLALRDGADAQLEDPVVA